MVYVNNDVKDAHLVPAWNKLTIAFTTEIFKIVNVSHWKF